MENSGDNSEIPKLMWGRKSIEQAHGDIDNEKDSYKYARFRDQNSIFLFILQVGYVSNFKIVAVIKVSVSLVQIGSSLLRITNLHLSCKLLSPDSNIYIIFIHYITWNKLPKQGKKNNLTSVIILILTITKSFISFVCLMQVKSKSINGL